MWPFGKDKRGVRGGKSNGLQLKSGAAFFEYQCKFGETEIRPNHGVVAVVLDSSKEFGTANAVKIEPDGIQVAALRVASRDGGFMVMARTPRPGGDRLKPDDVVIWVPVSHSPEMALPGMDQRFGWIGFIGAKVNPVFDLARPSLEIICRY